MKTNQDGGSYSAKKPSAPAKELAKNQAKEGAGKMGYSQKFGPGRASGYDKGAMRAMDVMTHGGASKYMKDGPGQGFFSKLNRTVTRGLGDIGVQIADFAFPDRHRAINKDPRAKQNAYRNKLNENKHYDRSRELAATNQTFGTLADFFDDDGLGNSRTGVSTDYREDVRKKNEAYEKSQNKQN